nr:DUF5074 domain-containing protein [uncultured Flavobacterium sp.]
MNFKKYLVALIAGSFLFVSCNDDDNKNGVAGDYDNGVLILNEGNSSASTASVSFLSNNGTVEQDIYRTVNPTSPALGTLLQNIFFDGDKAFIVSGGSNKVTVVNRYTFKFIASIETDFNAPRYGTVVNGKAYVTNMALWNDNTDDFLTVINLSDYSTSKIAMGKNTEKIISENGKLYISNGYYGTGTTVTVYNPSTNTTEATIELSDSPEAIAEEEGVLYVLGGTTLKRINLATNQVNGTLNLPSGVTYSAKNLVIEDHKLYFTAGTSVYTMALNAATIPTTPLFTYNSTSTWGGMYGFNVEDDKIYVAEGGNFASDSEVYTYSLTGEKLQTYAVGVGPNGFYFND